MFRSCLALVILLVFAIDLSAQTGADGPRVRVTYGCDVDCRRVVGTVVAFSPDSMSLRVEGQPGTERMALASISRYEIDRGPQPNHKGVMAGVGAMVGLVGGGVVGFLADRPTTTGCGSPLFPGDVTQPCDSGQMLLGAGVGLAVGAGVGYLIGRAMTPNRWVEVDLGYAQVGLAPRGLGLGVAVQF
jgi:hypothetical protein